ncbi:hypothetical protein, partial [Bacillus mycoides]|uniref:hypothetical protein n=1 Tax=Bacillus mycoides TaxID=1405 RepID=UPI003D1C972D
NLSSLPFRYFPVNYNTYWFSLVMPFFSKLSFDNFKRFYFSVDILPQVFIIITNICEARKRLCKKLAFLEGKV